MKNLITLKIDYLDSLPFRESIPKSKKVATNNQGNYPKINGKFPYEIQEICMKRYKNYDEAFSYYCKKVPVHCQMHFIQSFDGGWWQWNNDFNRKIYSNGGNVYELLPNKTIIYLPYYYSEPAIITKYKIERGWGIDGLVIDERFTFKSKHCKEFKNKTREVHLHNKKLRLQIYPKKELSNKDFRKILKEGKLNLKLNF